VGTTGTKSVIYFKYFNLYIFLEKLEKFEDFYEIFIRVNYKSGPNNVKNYIFGSLTSKIT